jgi:hypothetical protein
VLTQAVVTRLTRCLFLLLVFSACSLASAQDNYEIQVYGSETVAPKTTMVELHSNFTVDGSKPLPGSVYAADRLYPTNHAQHETVEITQGITNWSEVASTSSPARAAGRACSGWAIISDRVCAFRIAGTGQWA